MSVLVYIAAAVTALWGVAQLFATRGVVAGFGELTAGNRRIITLEWTVEGVALIETAALVTAATAIDSHAAASTGTYVVTIATLVALAAVSLLSILALIPLLQIEERSLWPVSPGARSGSRQEVVTIVLHIVARLPLAYGPNPYRGQLGDGWPSPQPMRRASARRREGGVMRPQEAIGQAEQRYLRAICGLAAGEAKAAVSFREVQEYLSCTDNEANECCDFWTRRGAIEWPALGHIALTHLGLARAKSNGNNGAESPHVEPVHGPDGLGPDAGSSCSNTETASVSVVIPKEPLDP